MLRADCDYDFLTFIRSNKPQAEEVRKNYGQAPE